jgi:small subunit ribosomal protein S8
LVRILDQEGMISGFRAYANYLILIRLRYEGLEKISHIRGIQRVSRPGCRVYTRFSKVPRVLGGMGITVLSTSKGIMADREARKYQLGGEILCRIW